MLITSKYNYLPMERSQVNGERRYVTPDGESLPSVTTILSATSDKSFLVKWADRIGQEEADRIRDEAAKIGQAMHVNLENFILGKKQEGMVLAKILAHEIIKHGLSNVQEIWGCEVALYSKGLYAGTTDNVGVHNNIESIIDFKNSLKWKRKEWITDYFKQTCAYGLSHNEMYGTNIRRCVIMIATREAKYQEFIIEGDEFDHYANLWTTSVSEYYDKYRT